jgi:hypothetical protein
MALIDDDEATNSAETVSQDDTSGAQTFGFSSSRGAANPYTGQLQTLLSKYLENTDKAATEKQALLDKARERIMARSAGPDSAEMAFRIAAALGKPTRTGSFGETLGNVAETTGEALAQRRKASQELEDLNLKYQLAASDVKGEGQKAQISALSALARSSPKDRLTEIEKMQEVIDDPKASEGAKKNAQARITFLTTRAAAAARPNEIEQLLAKMNDPNVSEADRAVYKQRLDKLNYIPPSAKTTNEIDQLVEKLNDPNLSEATKAIYKQRLDKLNYIPPGAAPATNEIDQLLAKINNPAVSEADKAVYRQRLTKLNYVPQGPVAVPNEIDQLLAKINDPAVSESDKAVYRQRLTKLNYVPPSPAAAAASEIDQLLAKINDPAVSESDKTVYRQRLTKLNYIPQGASAATNEIDQLLAKINDPNVSASDKAVYRQRLTKLNYIPAAERVERDAGKPQSPAGRVAADEGLRPGTPAYQERVKALTGEGKGMNLSPQEIKELFEAEDIVNASKGVLLSLQKAKQLSPKAYEGFGAGARRTIARNVPGVGKSEGVTATTELETLVMQNALEQLKAIFGGAPTEGERKILLDIQGSLSMGDKERQAVYDRAMQAAARRLRSNQEKMDRIRKGGYSSRTNPQQNADGGLVGYADGGLVNMADGGEFSMANLGRAVGQGLGLGFGDEAIARVRAKMEGRPYEDVVREEREAYQKFQEKNPFIALGTELVSGAIPTIGMAMIPGAGTPGAVAGAGRMGMAASRLSQFMPQFMKGPMARAAGAGATTGAIAGAGSETEGNRTSGALTGGATGAVLGPTVAKGIQLGGQGVKAVKNAIRPSPNTVEQRATNKVLEAMGRDEMDLPGLVDKMNKDVRLGVKSTIMDASPSLATLGEAVVTRPGPGRRILGQGLNERLEGGREAAASRALRDVGKGVDYTAQEDKLIGTLRSNANNLYDTAYAHGSVDDTRIMKVLEDDTFKKAFKEAQAIANKEARAAELRGEDASRFKLNDIYDLDKDGNMVSVGKIPDVRTLDYIKRGIDALIDKGYKGEGMSKAEANALKDLRKAYIGVIDENVPEYAAARAKYAGDMEVLDALRLGRTDYLSPKMLPAEAKKLVDGMSDAERDALRAGVAQSLLTKVMDAPQQVNAAQRIIGAPATRKRLEALFQDPNEYKVFEAALQRESELFRSAQDIVRGSRTANKTAAMADLKAGSGIFDIAGEAVDVATGSPGTVIGRVLKYLQARTSLDEKTAGEIATMLKSGTFQEVQDTLNRLQSSSAKFLEAKDTSSRRLKTTSGTVGAAAPSTSLAAPESEAPADEDKDEDDEAKVDRILRSLKDE